MPKSFLSLVVASVLIPSALSAPGGQKSPPPAEQRAPAVEAKPLRAGDFPLKAEVKKGSPNLTPSDARNLDAAACKEAKGRMAILCREGVAATTRAFQRVVAKISDRLYALDGPQLPAGVYPARSVDDGKGFEFLIKDAKGNCHVVRYSIRQEIKATGPPKIPHH